MSQLQRPSLESVTVDLERQTLDCLDYSTRSAAYIVAVVRRCCISEC